MFLFNIISKYCVLNRKVLKSSALFLAKMIKLVNRKHETIQYYANKQLFHNIAFMNVIFVGILKEQTAFL